MGKRQAVNSVGSLSCSELAFQALADIGPWEEAMEVALCEEASLPELVMSDPNELSLKWAKSPTKSSFRPVDDVLKPRLSSSSLKGGEQGPSVDFSDWWPSQVISPSQVP